MIIDIELLINNNSYIVRFRYVFVISVNKNIIPVYTNNKDEQDDKENSIIERSLLYVSITRAQIKAYVSSYGEESEFLEKSERIDRMKKEIVGNGIVINNGESLLRYLKQQKINVISYSALDGSQNCIYLPDNTSLNWKARNGEVRINCKKELKTIIEQRNDLHMLRNGVGDSVRDYSLLLKNIEDIEKVINTLRNIDGYMLEC